MPELTCLTVPWNHLSEQDASGKFRVRRSFRQNEVEWMDDGESTYTAVAYIASGSLPNRLLQTSKR
jgi:hypothetical protein